MDRERKKRKTDDEDDDGIDRISELPNSILCHILSLLPSKESAATSILSTRWKFLFAFVPHIDLECSYSSDNSFLDFFKLCNRMILLRQGIPIRKLKLSIWRISERLRVILEPSIISALQCRIQELEVFVDHLEPSTVQVQGFPHGIFSCESLVKLKLSSRGAMSSDLPDTVSLPNLKVLHLDLRLCVNEFSIHRLILGCPRLKDLHIGFISTRYCDAGSKKKSKVLDFSSPSLNKLVLDSTGGEYVTILVGSSNLETLDYRLNSYCNDGSEKVVINAPNLKRLATESPLCRLSFVESLKNLVGTKITAEHYHLHGLSGEDVIDHLHRAQNVESICIGRVILEVIQVHRCLHLLPTFKNLKSLELEFKKDRRFKSSHMYAWRALPHFFKSAPNLEVLVFNHVNWGKNDGGN